MQMRIKETISVDDVGMLEEVLTELSSKVINTFKTAEQLDDEESD